MPKNIPAPKVKTIQVTTKARQSLRNKPERTKIVNRTQSGPVTHSFCMLRNWAIILGGPRKVSSATVGGLSGGTPADLVTRYTTDAIAVHAVPSAAPIRTS